MGRKDRDPRLHFDIQLVSPDSNKTTVGSNDSLSTHAVRKEVYHPLPSTGYKSMLGNVPEVDFKQGLSVTCIDQMIPEAKPYSFESTISPLLFAYCLEGSRFFKLSGSSRENTMHSGQWYVGYIPECRGKGILAGSPRFRGVALRFDPLVLFDLLEGRVEGLPAKLGNLLTQLEGGVITLTGAMSAALTNAVAQLSLCKRETTFNRLVFESKIIDVLMLHLQEIGGCATASTTSNLSKRERIAAEQARAMLQRNLLDPPSLDALAAELKVAPYVMKSIFQKAFGISVPSFVLLRRMEAAKQLLDSGDYQVAEVAQEVGYRNTSWFIDVFNRHYGLKPGEYLKQTKQLYCISTPWADSQCGTPT